MLTKQEEAIFALSKISPGDYILNTHTNRFWNPAFFRITSLTANQEIRQIGYTQSIEIHADIPRGKWAGSNFVRYTSIHKTLYNISWRSIVFQRAFTWPRYIAPQTYYIVDKYFTFDLWAAHFFGKTVYHNSYKVEICT